MKRLYGHEDLVLRPADSGDERLLYQLLEERYAAGVANIDGMALPELPSFEEHCAFLAGNPYRRLEIVARREAPEVGVGMMYLTHDQVGGCFVLKEFSGRGIGPSACYAFFLTCDYPVIAHFNPENRAGWRMADRTGWVLVERQPHRLTYELRQPPTDPMQRIKGRRAES